MDHDFIWPNIEHIINSRTNTIMHESKNKCEEREIIIEKGNISILEEDADLKFEILVTSHCGTDRHRVIYKSLRNVKENVYWTSIDGDFIQVLRSCIYHLNQSDCYISSKYPAAQTITMNFTITHKKVHFEYIYMGVGAGTKTLYS